ncbi:hypothetical protein EW093_06870 [Thiospirochaeta perfilievii]|uniref:Uncharacterized protein n=1 Tax=Thiospirochaeta perfilievii TaxID=252967 RepID=A0A5C1QBJ0_9SPIO|nr:hypothetical protein [Thiospirochaeta perfilievii]QEN04430.1 hypothetical protein EW093_06870 [Thiospirochaeta perfilievii]
MCWWDNENDMSSDVITGLIEQVSSIYYKKVLTIWGNVLDVDSDDKINILFSKNLNESNIAIGFFNPNDLYLRDKNISSNSYNPYSNEGEVLYLGVPENDNFSFSINSLLATFVHEFCHLINFEKKTYSQYLRGNLNPPVMELFLDEGLAHLTESLCGLGVSGGNIGFYAKYLSDPAAISLVHSNHLGQSDSAGKRGAVSGFLSWLFWEKGGLFFNDSNEIVDNGGIAFLVDLVVNQRNSWESIGATYGIDSNVLFEQWVSDLVKNDPFNGIYDPSTSEPLNLDPWMGSYNISETISINVAGVNKNNLSSDNIEILPFSFKPWRVENSGFLLLQDISGDSFVRLSIY